MSQGLGMAKTVMVNFWEMSLGRKGTHSLSFPVPSGQNGDVIDTIMEVMLGHKMTVK